MLGLDLSIEDAATAPRSVADFYVDSALGNNANDGLTPATAKATIAGAIALGSALSGKRLGISGTFRESAGAIAYPIIFVGYGASQPIWLGSTTILAPTWTAYTASADGSNLALNPGFELGSGSTFTNWSNAVTGSSTVNRETSITHGGANAVRLDVDASNSVVQIQTASANYFTLTGGVTYRIRFWHKVSGTPATPGYALTQAAGADAGKYLQSNGTWVASSTTISPSPASTTTYQQEVRDFVAPSTGTYQLILKRNGTSTGKSLYYDDVEIYAPAQSPNANTYSAPVAPQIYNLAIGGTSLNLTAGAGQSSLLVGEFYWTGGFLYVRTAGGAPVGDMEYGTLDNAATIDAIDNVVFRNINFKHFKKQAVRYQNCNFLIEDCTAENNGQLGDNGQFRAGTNSAAFCTGAIRKNTYINGRADHTYLFNALNSSITDHVMGRASGAVADGIQLDVLNNVHPPQPVNNYIARNRIDTRLTTGPKGCIIFRQGDGNVAEYNTLQGGHFGLNCSGNSITIRHNLCAKVGVAGDALNWPAARYTNESLPQDGWTDFNNVYAYSRMGVHMLGWGDAGSEQSPLFTNMLFDHLTVVYNELEGFSDDGPQLSGTISNCIIYNPTASGPDLRIRAIPTGTTLTRQRSPTKRTNNPSRRKSVRGSRCESRAGRARATRLGNGMGSTGEVQGPDRQVETRRPIHSRRQGHSGTLVA
jgi:hypothetical protein